MFSHKLVAVMNQSLESGVLLNALAHLSISLGARLGQEPLQLVDYVDQNALTYPSISKMPFIILRASAPKLKELLQKVTGLPIQWSAFTDTMTGGTWEEQIARTKIRPSQDVILYGLVLFGPWDTISELTRKFSLWK